jgi:cardiolipin synthase
MRFFKFIFGRFFIITSLVIFQVALFIAAIYFSEIFFADYFINIYYFVNLGFSIVGVIIVLVLVNRETNPNYIMPWIVIILLLPIVGVVIYAMFSQNRVRPKYKKIHRKISVLIQPLQKRSEQVEEEVGQENPIAFGQSQYLSGVGNFPIYKNCKVDYLCSGETFFERLKSELERAEKFIFLEFFIIQEGQMWSGVLDILKAKIDEGVQVKLMYDDIGSIKTLPSGYYKKLQKIGIECVKFNKFVPIVTAVHNNRDHRKIVVIDGKVGFVAGANLADEYINVRSRFGHWKDSAVMLSGQAVESLTLMFLQLFYSQTNNATEFSYFLPNADSFPQEKGYVLPFSDGPSPIYKEKISQTAIINMLSQAQQYVYITTPYLIVDFQLKDAIKQAAKRGVDVRIITPAVPDKRSIHTMTRSSYDALIEAGVKIYEYTPGFMHAKSYVADDKIAIVGTMNMDYRSLVHHFECGVWLYDVPAIEDIKKDILQSISVSRLVSINEKKLSIIGKIVRILLQLFAPML